VQRRLTCDRASLQTHPDGFVAALAKLNQAGYFSRAPSGTSSRNPASTGAPPSSEAASNMPFDSRPRILRGARLATMTILRPMSFSGS